MGDELLQQHRRPLRLCFVTPTFSPVTGGAETHIRTLAGELVRRGHVVTVITERYDGSAAEEEVAGVHLRRISTPATRWNEADCVPWEERVLGLFEDCFAAMSSDVDVVHGFCQVGLVAGSMLGHSVGVPVVATPHETDPGGSRPGLAVSRFVYETMQYDAVIVGSEAFRSQMLSFGVPESRLHLVHHGVDAQYWRDTTAAARDGMRRALAMNDGERLVLTVSRFTPRKGLLTFVRAMRIVADQVSGVRALIVGSLNSASSAYRDRVEAEIRRLGLSAVAQIRTSDLAHEQMPLLYAAASVVVQASHEEGLGLAVIEALAMGRPVVTTAVRGLNEVVRGGVMAEVAAAGDEAELAAAIVTQLRASHENRAVVGERNRRLMRDRFGAAQMGASYEEVYYLLTR